MSSYENSMLLKEIYSLLPLACLLCKGKAQEKIALCRACQKELPWNKSDMSAFYYQSPIDNWITSLKFRKKLNYANLLGHLFIEKIKQQKELPELIIPIPLHRRRLCKRGFNQALEIAKPICRHLKIPLDTKILQRCRPTKPQSELTEKERSENMKNAFHCTKPITATHIALFDDVITTGNTMQAAYHTLKQCGVGKIEIWSCAKVKRYALPNTEIL